MTSVGPPSALAAPVEEALGFDARAEAASVAARIALDMTELGSLKAQQERFGPSLKAPLPISTIDDAASVWRPILARDFLAYEGTSDGGIAGGTRRDPLSSNLGIEGLSSVTQAVGSGKSKLAYAEGLDPKSPHLTLFVRILKESEGSEGLRGKGELSAPWAALVEAVARHRLTEGKIMDISTNKWFWGYLCGPTVAMIRLLVTSYVEWAMMVLEAMGPTGDKARQREAALRCLRNTRSDEAVARLFKQRLAEMLKTTPVSELGHCACPIERHLKAVHDRMEQVMGPGLVVLIWYQDAEALMEPAVDECGFDDPGSDDEHEHEYKIGKVPYREPGRSGFSLFRCFHYFVRCLYYCPIYWRQAVCASTFELDQRLASGSPKGSLYVFVLSHSAYQPLTVAHMVTSLSRYFSLPATAPLPDSTLALLRQLQGRPRWFFDHFWPALWARLEASATTKPKPNLQPIEELIALAAADAVASSRADASRIVERAWAEHPELCLELYTAIKLNGGEVAAQFSVKPVLVRLGLAPRQDGSPYLLDRDWAALKLLHDEPAIGTALEAKGDQVVAAAAMNGGADADPVLRLLKEAPAQRYSYRSGDDDVWRFRLTSSVRGPLPKLLADWEVIRAGILARAGASAASASAGAGVAPAPVSRP